MKSENSTVQIKCISDSTMYFYQSQGIRITNLEFIGCGGNQVRHVEEFMVENVKFEGQENSGTALELIETTAQIVSSTFLSNRKGLYRKCECSPSGDCRSGFFGGAIIATNSSIDISRSRFEDNRAEWGGAIFAEQDSIINMSGNIFVSNKAKWSGGVLYSDDSIIIIRVSEFQDNYAQWGGVLYSRSSTITIEACKFHDNNATHSGGAILYSPNSIITIVASEFHDNNATTWSGGVLVSYNSTITIEGSGFHDNRANMGRVLSSIISTITIKASKFHGNNATDRGGVLYVSSCNITIAGTNNVSPIGAIIYATSRSAIRHNIIYSFLLIDNNKADRYAVIYLSDSEFIGNDSGNVIFSSNLGSFVMFNSNIMIAFTGYAAFVNNTPSQTVSGDFQEGGAITLFQSNVLMMENASGIGRYF